MDIASQVELTLRAAGYDTWSGGSGSLGEICFENGALMGFVSVFSGERELLARWEEIQRAVLGQYSTVLRHAGLKAWNVYSVFLAGGMGPARSYEIARIEENFALTRKIARAGIRTREDLEHALLPLLRIQSQPQMIEADTHERLRGRLKSLRGDVLTAFLGPADPDEVAKILLENS